MRDFRDDLASRLVAAGHNQNTLAQAGFGADAARRLLGLDARGLNLDTVTRAAAMIGCALTLVPDGAAVAAAAVAQANRGKRAPTFVPDESADTDAAPLIRKRKTVVVRKTSSVRKTASVQRPERAGSGTVSKAATVRRARDI
jgi:hypothetical protein